MVWRGSVLIGVGIVCLWVSAAGVPSSSSSSSSEELGRLRSELVALGDRLAQVEGHLSDKADRDSLAHLEARMDGFDDGAWAEAVELGIVGRIASLRTGLPPAAQKRAAAAVVRESRAAGLDPLLVAAVIEVESTWRNFAVSSAGAVGLMQVMPATGSWFGEKLGVPSTGREELFDPERNIHIGVHYLAELHRRFGRMDWALIAYNAGPTKAREIVNGPDLDRWLANYPRKVKEARRRFEQQVASR